MNRTGLPHAPALAAPAAAPGVVTWRTVLGVEISLDDIPWSDYLREYAKLGKQAVIAGLYDRVEIWDEAAWQAYKEKTEAQGDEIAERLKLRHVVVTSVTRDDLPDGVAGIFASTIREIKRVLPRVSKSDATILLTGESGTGKEVIARNVHEVAADLLAACVGALPGVPLDPLIVGRANVVYERGEKQGMPIL
mgnify:CR=1 FL=1